MEGGDGGNIDGAACSHMRMVMVTSAVIKAEVLGEAVMNATGVGVDSFSGEVDCSSCSSSNDFTLVFISKSSF